MRRSLPALPALVALVALAIVAAACGGDDDSAVTPTSGPTSTSRTTPTAPAPACPDDPAPGARTSRSEAEADVDGDGEQDTVSSHLVDDQVWHLRVALAAGGGADVALGVLASESVAVLGGGDADGDGAEEIWASTGSGASATIIGLARFDDCSLTQVTFDAGTPAEFPIGGSVGTASGLECTGGAQEDDPDLTAYTVTNTGEDRYDLEAIGYVLDGDVLTRGDTSAASISNRDPLFLRATGFSCGSLTF